jgi:hypothetical protein
VSSTQLPTAALDRHLRLMRLTTFGFMLTVPVAAAVFVLLEAGEVGASSWAVSAVAAVAALWVGFTANRDAQARIDRIKRRFAAEGDVRRLLLDHRLVNLAVLVRLELMVVAAVVAGIWGPSQSVAWGVLGLAAAMMGLSWPTADKTVTLLKRAREQRGR